RHAVDAVDADDEGRPVAAVALAAGGAAESEQREDDRQRRASRNAMATYGCGVAVVCGHDRGRGETERARRGSMATLPCCGTSRGARVLAVSLYHGQKGTRRHGSRWSGLGLTDDPRMCTA